MYMCKYIYPKKHIYIYLHVYMYIYIYVKFFSHNTLPLRDDSSLEAPMTYRVDIVGSLKR